MKLRIPLAVALLLALLAALAIVAVATGDGSSRGCVAGQSCLLETASGREGQGRWLDRSGTPDSKPHQPQLAAEFSVYRAKRFKPIATVLDDLVYYKGQAMVGAANAAGRPGSGDRSGREGIASSMLSWSDAPDEWWKHRIFLPLAERSYYMDPAVVSDDFNEKTLDRTIWKLINPRRDATLAMIGTFTRDAWLCISVPGSSIHNIWEDGNHAARVMQPVRDTDFEIEVKFESGVSQKYQMQGVLIEQDEDHFLRLEFHGDGVGTRLFAATFAPGSADTLEPYVRLTQRIIDQPNVAPLYMRVRHLGDRWTLFWSRDGVDWSAAVSFRHDLSVTKAGVYAGNAASGGQAPPAHTACFDYFFNTERPITPEDPPLFSVAGSIVGHGLITMEPAQQRYHLGDIVTLTAIADPGWFFTGWSGDLSGTDNPAIISIDGNMAVTATFTKDEHTLSVNVEGEGTVAKDPDQAVYYFGDVVNLTATADPGWSFADWSGDLSGTDNPAAITMDGNKVVTATFTPEEYTLTANVGGEGSVAKDPDEPIYYYGDVVSLTATASPGWSFAAWSGDLSGTDNPAAITMDGNEVVTATFTRDEYTLTVGVEGEGIASKDPQRETYFHGDVVTLTATADPGWSFAGWSGDLSGMDNPETITMDGNKDVTATFNEDQYTLTVNVAGQGSVNREPDRETYTYGEVVTLTATPDPGWSFAGWSGDLSGSTNPDTVIMGASKSVTATFSQDEYASNSLVVGDSLDRWLASMTWGTSSEGESHRSRNSARPGLT